MNKYIRQTSLDFVGQDGQKMLDKSSVLIIGAGGLGCPILQYLTGAGIGRIGILDFDEIDITNLHRQVLYNTEDISHSKAEVAAKKLQNLNPDIIIEPIKDKLSSTNALGLFSLYDIIVDATDNYATRYIINDASEITGKPVVYGSLFKTEGQISVFNYHGGPSYRCIFETPPKQTFSCNETGVLGSLCGIVGSIMANEVIKLCLNQNSFLSGKLMIFNSTNLNSSFIEFERKASSNIFEMKNQHDYEGNNSCANSTSESNIDCEQFKKLLNTNTLLLDVRESWEEPKIKANNIINIPLDELESLKNKIPIDKEIVVFCQSGGRSKLAIQILQREYNFKNLKNLQHGVSEL